MRVPKPGFVTELDRSQGAEDSSALLRRRRADDVAALAVTGSTAVHLDLLDAQFPAYDVPRLRAAVAEDPSRFIAVVANAPEIRTDPHLIRDFVAPHIDPDAVVYGPTKPPTWS